ncbi:MAG: RNA polymerase factor sigma-54 [Pseudomonadota bacterium]
MALKQTLGLRPSIAMTTRMQASLNILGMSADALCDYLAEIERRNPYLAVRLPSSYRGGGTQGDPVALLTGAPESLFDHVRRQIELSFRDPSDKSLAFALAQSLEPTGWLSADLAELAAAQGTSLDQAERVLATCQEFEPAGLFARTLAECLRLQARDAGVLTPAMAAVLDNLDAVAADALDGVAKTTGIAQDRLADALAALRSFDPKPGLAYAPAAAPVRLPDLTARRGPKGWRVELNRSTLPTIEVSDFPDLSSFTAEDRRFSRTAFGEARWLERTVARRHSTVLSAASAIVARQRAYLERGQGFLRSLALSDIAETLGLHPSTISRATADRWMDTPQGLVSLKSLFSRPLGDENTGATRDAALAAIKRVIQEEDPGRPLSDAAIAKAASTDGPTISRRTVAKYRELLGIATSYERRRKHCRAARSL